MSRRSRSDWFTLGMAVATLGAGVALWGRLPAEMAVHFSASGTPDNFVSKPLAVALVPALMAALGPVFDWSARLDQSDDPRTLAVVQVATVGLLAAVQGVVLAWNLGYDVPFDAFLVGVAVWGVAVVGYSLARERGWVPV